MDTADAEGDIPGPEHGGKYIAWDEEALRIVGSGTTIREAIESAVAKGVDDPVIEFVPRTDCYFVGGV